MLKFKNYSAYLLLFSGFLIIFKTVPLAFYTLLYVFNIPNTIGIDMTNSLTFALSVIKADFYYGLFLFAVLSVLIGIFLLFRKQRNLVRDVWYDWYDWDDWDRALSIICSILVGQTFFILAAIFLPILKYSLFAKHTIYLVAFLFGCLINLLFFILYGLIWLDETLNKNVQFFFLFILCIFSYNLCDEMFLFIDLYGVSPIEKGVGTEIFYEAFDLIFASLGF